MHPALRSCCSATAVLGAALVVLAGSLTAAEATPHGGPSELWSSTVATRLSLDEGGRG